MITLRRRLLYVLTSVTASVLFVGLFLVYVLVARDELHALDQTLLDHAHQLSRDLTSDGASLQDLQVQIPEGGETDAYAAVFDARGKLSLHTRGALTRYSELERVTGGDAIPMQGLTLDLATTHGVLRAVVLPLSDRSAVLYASSRKAVDEDLGFLLRVLPSIFLLAIAFTALIAHWLGGVLGRDVLTMAQVARAVSGGDLGARVGQRAHGSRESHELGKDLDDMIERLGELLAAQRRFATDAAHELRSPIATIRGELQLALRRERSASDYREVLEEVLEDVELLAKLAEDLLSLSRFDAGTSTSGDVSLREIVDDAVWMAHGLAHARRVKLEIVERTPEAGTARVTGARGELARVVRNLLDNAIRYGASEEETVSIELIANGLLTVAVVDHGPGVSPGEREAIFSAFHRGEQGVTASESGGAGLGLFIAREIARAHGGDVLLDPADGEGARFLLELPRAQRRVSLPPRSPSYETDETEDTARPSGQPSEP
jgi:two-component system OmpR family sensor kinase